MSFTNKLPLPLDGAAEIFARPPFREDQYISCDSVCLSLDILALCCSNLGQIRGEASVKYSALRLVNTIVILKIPILLLGLTITVANPKIWYTQFPLPYCLPLVCLSKTLRRVWNIASSMCLNYLFIFEYCKIQPHLSSLTSIIEISGLIEYYVLYFYLVQNVELRFMYQYSVPAFLAS